MGEPQDDLIAKVQEDQDPFKKILAKLPGFGGYIERQTRRDADKLLRQTLADRFRELESRVSALQREFISQGEIAFVDDLEASAIKLRTFSDRIRTAARGYSGLFDAVKINEEELARIYNYDAAMLDLVEEVSRAIDHITASMGSDGLPAAIRNLETASLRSLEVLNRRDEVVFGGLEGPGETAG